MQKFRRLNTIVITLIIVVQLFFSQCHGQDEKCIPKSYGEGYLVCVCNSTYCDTVQSLSRLSTGNYWTVTSNKAGLRFEKTQSPFANQIKDASNETLILTIDHNKKYQTISGFGGAFTDAATINIMNVTNATRQKLMDSYFSTDGLEYTFGRVPMGGADFSTRLYTYDDDHDGDFNLTYFSLQEEDLKYKIPIIQQALAMSSRPIKMFSSPWTAPAWMKTNNELIGKGELRGTTGDEYYKAWALYFLKFLQEYQKHGINFWGVTAQNEPLDGNIVNFTFNCMGFTAETQRIFIESNLGPMLDNNGFSDLKIMMLDDQRLLLPQWAQEVLRNDSNAKDYVDGIAIHWYLDFLVTHQVLDQTHALFPDKFILATEACEGSLPWVPKVVVGSWDRGVNYAIDIIEDLLHWTEGWVDWNIALNMDGGPNWTGDGDDSPILVNSEADEFYKQPMYYVLGHFSKFVPPGCVVIDTQSSDPTNTEFVQITFDCPQDQSTVLVILNRGSLSRTVSITDPIAGTFTTNLSENSITTITWWST